MTKIAVEIGYTITSYATIDLPEGKSWEEDVADHYVKWGKLHVKFKGDEVWYEYDGGDASTDSIDFKYPDHVKIFETGEEGDADYDRCLVEE
jgi:hypothetical protein